MRHQILAQRGRVASAATLILALTLGGCDSLLDVSLPGSTTAASLDDPSFAELMVLSAQGEFERGVSDYMFTSGFMGGELLGGQGYRADHPAIARALDYLWKSQEPEGCWYGRWGVNYIYGTWQVLLGLQMGSFTP